MLRRPLLWSVLALAGARASAAQTYFIGVEPNETKAQATRLNGVQSGDSIGVPVFEQDPGILRIRHAASPPAILRHELRPSGLLPLARMDVLGRDDAGGVVDPTSTTALQSAGAYGGPANYLCWYGFGRSEEVYIDLVAGGFLPGEVYRWSRLTSTVVIETDLGVLQGSEFTLSASRAGGFADLELHLFDGEGAPLPEASNDESGAPGGEPRLAYTLAPGGYLIAVARHEAASHRPLPPTDLRTTSTVLDFKGPFLTRQAETGDWVDVRIEDGQGTAVLASATVQRLLPYEVLWFSFEVRGAATVGTFCAAEAGSATCACLGAAPARSGMGCLNSSGRGASATGRALGADWFFLAEDLPPSALAVAFVATTPAPPAVAFGGLFCLGGGALRVGQGQADAVGAVSLGGFNPVARGFSVGQSLYLQVAYRDTLAPTGCAVNATAGYRFFAR